MQDPNHTRKGGIPPLGEEKLRAPPQEPTRTHSVMFWGPLHTVRSPTILSVGTRTGHLNHNVLHMSTLNSSWSFTHTYLIIRRSIRGAFYSEVFYGTQYDPMVIRSYYRFFFMGKMIIWYVYIIWKKIPRSPLILSKTFHIFYFLYYNNIILHFRIPLYYSYDLWMLLYDS
jgi:hypothetical protein